MTEKSIALDPPALTPAEIKKLARQTRLNDLVNVLCFRATLEGMKVKIVLTRPRAKKKVEGGG